MAEGEGPTVSIVTIAWRNESFAEPFTASLADAAERTTGRLPQLVIVQNGPEGEAATAAVVRASRHTRLTPVVVRLDTNAGFSGGANAGVSAATGEIVVVANLDVTFDPRFLSVVLREATQSEWDFLAPRVLQGPSRRDEGVSRRKASHRLAWVSPTAVPKSVPGGNGCCLVLRRETLFRRERDVAALFDAEYQSFNEDIDLFWWAERNALTIRYVPDACVEHALAGSFGGAHRFHSRPLDVQRRVMANYRVTVWKNARTPGEWLGWPVGETQYLGQVLLSRRLAGLKVYAASWLLAIDTARTIRRRRGRLRTDARSRT